MTDAIRDVLIRINIEQPNTAKLEGGAKQVETALTEVEKQAQKVEQALDGALDPGESQNAIRDNLLGVKDASVQASKGVFMLGRSIALASATGEEDLKEMVERVARVQASFDAFRGIITIFNSVRNAITAVSAATAVQVTEQTALATSQVALSTGSAAVAAGNQQMASTNVEVAATATASDQAMQGLLRTYVVGSGGARVLTHETLALTGATVHQAAAAESQAVAQTAVATTGKAAGLSMRALATTLGPVALALGVAGSLFVALESNAAESKNGIDSFGDKLDGLVAGIGDLSAAQDRLNQVSDTAGIIRGIEDRIDAERELTEAIAERIKVSEALDFVLGREVRVAGLRGFEAQEKLKDAIRGNIDDLEDLQRVLEFQALNAGARQQVGGLDEEQEFLKQNLAVNELLLQVINERGQAAERQLVLREREIDLTEKSLAQARQDLDLARQAVDLAKDQADSVARQFGALDPEQQREARRAAARFKGGADLTADEAQLLGRFDQEILNDFQRQQAERGGFQKFAEDLGGLGLQEGIKRAQDQLKEAQEELGGPDGLIDTLQQVAEENRSAARAQRDILVEIIEDLRKQQQEVRNLEDQLERLRQ